MLAIVLSVAGLGFFCWLLFTLAIYALPFLIGLTAGLAALDGGGGIVGALLIGFVVSGAILAFGQIAVANTRMPLIRIVIGLFYAVPASIAGYQVAFVLAGLSMSPGSWQIAFAVAGAVLSGFTAFSRMTLFTPSPGGQGTGGTHSPIGRRPYDPRA